MSTKNQRGLALSGARVLITGAGSGIGRLMALGAARRGAGEVILWDLSAERAGAVKAEVEAAGATASVGIVDVADRAAVADAAKEAGPVDVLINNAGIVTGADLLDTTDEAIIRTFDVNTLALYWTTRAFLPAMRERARGSAVSTVLVAPYYINTGMFDGVTTKFPRLLPILDEDDVARRILDAIESGTQQLILPRLSRFMPAARVLPVRAFDRVMDFFGINRTMDHFTGRPTSTSGTGPR